MQKLPQFHKICRDCRFTWFSEDETLSSRCPHCGSDKLIHERVKFLETILAWLFAFVVLGLIAITVIELRTTLPKYHLEPMTQPKVEKHESQKQLMNEDQSKVSVNILNASKPSPISPKKTPSKPTAYPSTHHIELPLELEASSDTDETEAEIRSIEESPPDSPILKNHIAFNIWSLSELRLRKAYTELMNQASSSSDKRKKDYLAFVNNRTKKCGHLNSNFEKNINSLDQIKFKDNDYKALECFSSTNISEYENLHTLGYED